MEHTDEILEDLPSRQVLRCTVCGVERTRYRVFFNQVLIGICYKILDYCVKNKTYKISKRDIEGLSHTEYGNFCTLQRFGLLFYLKNEKTGRKIKGGYRGVPVTRMADFLQGKRKVAEYYRRDVVTGSNESSDNRIAITEIQKYKTYGQDYNNYLPTFVQYGQDLDSSDPYTQ